MAERSPEEYDRDLADDVKDSQSRATGTASDIKRVNSAEPEAVNPDLAKNEVPKYVAETGEENNLPGGEAVDAQSDNRSGGVGGMIKAKGEELKQQGIKEAKKEASKALLKKVGWESIKAGIKTQAVAAFNAVAAATSEYWIPILIGVIILILLIVGIVFYVKGTSGVNGGTPVQATDYVTDRATITKIMSLSGKDIAKELTDEMLSKLQTEMSTIGNDLSGSKYSYLSDAKKAEVRAKIAEVNTAITNFQAVSATSSKREELAKAVVTKVAELAAIISPAEFHFSGKTAYPLKPGTIKGYGKTLHYETVLNNDAPPKGKTHRTYNQYQKDTADAVDISVNAGVPIYAAFSGKITRVKSAGSDTKYIYLTGKDNNGDTFLAVYAHVTGVPSEGTSVNVGDQIGTIGSLNTGSHLHFELYKNEQAVVTTAADLADSKSSNPKYPTIGKYLYVRMLNTLNLDPTAK